MTLKLKIKGEDVELSMSEAEQVWQELDRVFGKRSEQNPHLEYLQMLRDQKFGPSQPVPFPPWPSGPTCGGDTGTPPWRGTFVSSRAQTCGGNPIGSAAFE